MRLFYGFILATLLLNPAWAEISIDPLINKISFQLNGEQWVTTKSALVNVRVNAAVADQGIENLQTSIMGKLSQLSNQGEWHILSFERQLDKTGLESIQIIAQARLPQTELGSLRSKAKGLSKAGETYTIDNVQFTPSDEEFKAANAALRNNLYLQAKAEIDTVNKNYPDQKFYLQTINFTNLPSPEPTPMIQEVNIVRAGATGSPPGSPLMVGNKIYLQANVTLAAIPEPILQKLIH